MPGIVTAFAGGVSGAPPASFAFITGTPTNSPRTGNLWVGYRITPAVTMNITEVGRFGYSGNNQAHPVSIFRVSDNVVMATGTVTAAGAGVVYNTAIGLLSLVPAVGDAGRFYVATNELANVDTWGDNANNTHTADATIDGVCYSSDGITWVYSASVDTTYGPPTFKYTL